MYDDTADDNVKKMKEITKKIPASKTEKPLNTLRDTIPANLKEYFFKNK